MSQFRENLSTDGRTDRKMDGHILFHRTLPATAGGPTTTFDDLQCIPEGYTTHSMLFPKFQKLWKEFFQNKHIKSQIKEVLHASSISKRW